MSDELKPCAHCGEAAELCCPSGLSWWARCSNKSCGMATKIAYSPEPVAAAWNRRADAAIAKRDEVDVHSLFNHIAHGDADHRQWLMTELTAWFSKSAATKEPQP